MSPSKAPAKDTSKPRSKAANSVEQVCMVRIELLRIEPLIWREVEVPTAITLMELHKIVQITMGWFDQHLWEFTIGEEGYGPPINENLGAAPDDAVMKVRLSDLLEPRETVIGYLYDFGDSWEHRITVTEIRPGLPGVSYPNYVGGEWDCPPEDCGGIPGYYNMLDALADPDNPDYAGAAENLEHWDPREVDESPLRTALGRIAKQRKAARTKSARKTT